MNIVSLVLAIGAAIALLGGIIQAILAVRQLTDYPNTKSEQKKWLAFILLIWVMFTGIFGYASYTTLLPKPDSSSSSTQSNSSSPIQNTTTAPAMDVNSTPTPIQSPSPSIINIGGNYTGIIDNTTYNVSAHMNLIVQQKQNNIGGELTTYLPLAPAEGPIAGTTSTDFSGKVSVQFTAQLTVQPGGKCGTVCTFNFQGHLYMDGSLRGTYTITQDSETGSWYVSK